MRTGIEKFDVTEILNETGNKLTDKVLVILIICVINKDDEKFYPQIFLEERLVV